MRKTIYDHRGKGQSLGQTDRQTDNNTGKREISLASQSWTHKNEICKIQIILQRSFMLEAMNCILGIPYFWAKSTYW